MEAINGISASWGDEDFLDSTADPGVSVSVLAEEVPALTVATVVGVTVVMLIAIIVVFVLGILIDCRQQRVIAEKMVEAKRNKHQRRVNTHPQDEASSIVHGMEEVGVSEAPAEVFRNMP